MPVRTLDQLLERIAFRVNRLFALLASGLKLSAKVVEFEQSIIASLQKEYMLRVQRLCLYVGQHVQSQSFRTTP